MKNIWFKLEMFAWMFLIAINFIDAVQNKAVDSYKNCLLIIVIIAQSIYIKKLER